MWKWRDKYTPSDADLYLKSVRLYQYIPQFWLGRRIQLVSAYFSLSALKKSASFTVNETAAIIKHQNDAICDVIL